MPDINPLPVSERTRSLLRAIRDEGRRVGADDVAGTGDAGGAERAEETDEADESDEAGEAEETGDADDVDDADEAGEAEETDDADGASEAEETDDADGASEAEETDDADEAGEAEESYDELLQRLVVDHHRYVLSERFHAVADADADDLQSIDEFELLDPSGEFDALVPFLVAAWADDLGDRARQPIKRTWESIAEEPFPDPDGDLREVLPFGAENWYRQRIEQTWFVFYLVDEDAAEVRVVDVEPMSEARGRYGLEK